MARTPQDVTDAELAVLQVLWDQGPMTVRQLADVLYTGNRPSQVATVQKLLERLESKGCVSRDREGGVYLFRAAVDRDELIGRRLQDLAEKLCGGSLTPLLTNLVRAKRLTAREYQELLNLIESLDPGSQPKRKRD
jgi:BlaI family transcriptional regulator, penicillinase repressor